MNLFSDMDKAAALIIMFMQMARSAEEELRNTMNNMNDLLAKKEKLRALADKLREKSTTSPFMPWPPNISVA